MIKCKTEFTFSEGNPVIHIIMSGHAGYAPIGEDIVCAAVSALWHTLIESLNNLTVSQNLIDMNIDTISIIDTSESKLLVNSFLIGMTAIANSYPNNVSVEIKHV